MPPGAPPERPAHGLEKLCQYEDRWRKLSGQRRDCLLGRLPRLHRCAALRLTDDPCQRGRVQPRRLQRRRAHQDDPANLQQNQSQGAKAVLLCQPFDSWIHDGALPDSQIVSCVHSAAAYARTSLLMSSLHRRRNPGAEALGPQAGAVFRSGASQSPQAAQSRSCGLPPRLLLPPNQPHKLAHPRPHALACSQSPLSTMAIFSAVAAAQWCRCRAVRRARYHYVPLRAVSFRCGG